MIKELRDALDKKGLGYRDKEAENMLTSAESIAEIVSEIETRAAPSVVAAEKAGVHWQTVDMRVARGATIAQAVEEALETIAEGKAISEKTSAELLARGDANNRPFQPEVIEHRWENDDSMRNS